MERFIQVTETLQRIVRVEAESEEEAYSKVQEAIGNGTFSLDCEDGMGISLDDVTPHWENRDDTIKSYLYKLEED